MALQRYKLPEQLQNYDPTKPIVGDTDMIGGLRIVSDLIARDSIPSAMRKIGMDVCIVGESNKKYIGADVQDANWINVANWKSSDEFTTVKIGNLTLSENINDKTLNVTNGNVNSSTVTSTEKNTWNAKVSEAPTDGKQYARKNSSWVEIEASGGYNYTNIIYCDSLASVGGDGTPSNPYQTPYDIQETVSTFTANTSTNGYTLNFVPDTSGVNIGDIVSGSNIQYQSRVVSKTGNTVVLDKPCTGNGSGVTVSHVTPKYVICTGNFDLTQSLYKRNVICYDFRDSFVQFGNVTFYAVNSAIICDTDIIGGYWSGTHASSKILTNNMSQNTLARFGFKPKKFFSIGTGDHITITNALTINIDLDCKDFKCVSGGILNASTVTTKSLNLLVKGNFYGLTGGFQLDYCGGTHEFYGSIETPTSVVALRSYVTDTTPQKCIGVGCITGQFGIHNISFTGILRGSCTSLFGTIAGKFELTGNSTISDCVAESILLNGYTLNVTGGNLSSRTTINSLLGLSGTLNIASALVRLTVGSLIYTTVTCAYDSTVIVENGATDYIYSNSYSFSAGKLIMNGVDYNYSYPRYSFSGTSKCIINGSLITSYILLSGSAEFINNGEINIVLSLNISGGIFTNKGKIYNSALEQDFINQSGGVIENLGIIISTTTNSLYACIVKSAGIFKNLGGRIKVANGKSPFKITANTTQAKELLVDGCRTYTEIYANDYGTGYTPTSDEEFTDYRVVSWV